MPQLCTVTTDDLRDYLISNFGEKVDANHLKHKRNLNFHIRQ